MIKYGILGAGWRAEFYLRIAALCPDKFAVSGICARNPEKAKYISEKYSANVVSTLEELLDLDCDFIVCCVNKASMIDVAADLCQKGVPLLMETPMGIDDESQKRFFDRYDHQWRIQVAEQFHLQPMNMAIKAIIDSGILGNIISARLCCCHDYHAASLIRYFLGTGEEMPAIETTYITDRVTKYNSRQGFLTPEPIDSDEKLKIFRFDGKTAIYDFESGQCFSDIRSRQLTVRGTNGEIVNDRCTYLCDGLPVSFTLERQELGQNGNLDGLGLLRITGNGQELYRTPLPYARLSDEETAVATCLLKMDEYLKTGKEFYSVQSAALDAKMFFE